MGYVLATLWPWLIVAFGIGCATGWIAARPNN